MIHATTPNPDDKFNRLSMDFTIHKDPGHVPGGNGLYLMICYGWIGDVDFYFGFQTDMVNPETGWRGRGIIFSRWKTQEEDFIRKEGGEDGWTTSDGGEGYNLNIGVRRAYDWGAGNYRAIIAPAASGPEKDGQWFGLWIENKDTDKTTLAGSLKFPYVKGKTFFQPQTYTTLEIYGPTPIKPIKIPEWHVSFKRPLGGRIKARGFESSYSSLQGVILNSNVRYDPADSLIHFQAGGTTLRTNPAEHVIFKPDKIRTAQRYTQIG